MIPGYQDYQEREHMTPFEQKTREFTDLVRNIADGRIGYVDETGGDIQPGTEIPEFSAIRCICGHNVNEGEMIPCHDCHCFMHAKCIDHPVGQRGTFRCPFCLLLVEGIDPFKELSGWIESVDSELKKLHKHVNEASQLASYGGMGMGYNDYGMMGGPMRNQRNNPNNLRQRKMQDISQSLMNLKML